MNRCLWSFVLWLAVIALAGCTEESFDRPIDLGETLEPAALLPDTETSPPVTVHDWIGQPKPGVESEVVEQEQPSAVDSVWNALLEGTAGAMEETASQP